MSTKEEFKILSPREHCLARPGMYIGSVSYDVKSRYVLGEWKKVKYVPALLKMVDEILDNCLDEAIRTDFAHANIIDVSFDGNKITVSDNGRGIPQDNVTTVDGKTIPRAAAAGTVTNAGTSFGDNRTTIGSHGLGSALVNYFSAEFHGKTWQNGSMISVDSKNGCDPSIPNNPKIKQSQTSKTDSGTIVKFAPDMSLFENKDNKLDEIISELVMDRLMSMAICFPKITFKFNKRKIGQAQFSKYIKNYSENYISFGNDYELQVGIISSEDGFRINSFINGVHTIGGGVYVDHIINELTEELIPAIKRKHKINVTKLMVKNNLGLLLFVNKFENPKFDSQTKERLTNTAAEAKQHFLKYSENINFKKIAQKLIKNEALIEPIIQAELAKRLANEQRAATKAQNKLKKTKVAKHVKANKRGGTIFLVEGDSAAASFLDVRNNNTQGCLPLRGVVKNIWDDKITNILANKELSDIISCMELNIADADSVNSTYYNDIAFLVDADHDGAHIATLLMAFFYKFWPELYAQKRIHWVQTPIMIIEQPKKEPIWVYEYAQAKKLKKEMTGTKGINFRYIKGLGSLKKDEYKRVIDDPIYKTINIDEEEMFEVMFGKDSEPRKKIMKN